jgi:hypothetical protein
MRQSLAQRQARPFVDVWSSDPAPPAPEEPLDVKRKNKHHKEKKRDKSREKRKSKDKERRRRRRDSSSGSSSDSEDSRDKRHRRKHRRRDDEDSDESRRRDKSSKKRKRDDQLKWEPDEAMMDESKREEFDLMQEMLAKKRKTAEEAETSRLKSARGEDLEDDSYGPTPIRDVGLGKGYGAAMLPGEADAYAQYVQDNKRIPRRGEIGLTAEEIEKYEDLGYQMSGSRHRRMNAVRIRKESQIYSHEEQRILAQVNNAERMKRENQVVADFRTILSSKLKEHAHNADPSHLTPPPSSSSGK